MNANLFSFTFASLTLAVPAFGAGAGGSDPLLAREVLLSTTLTFPDDTAVSVEVANETRASSYRLGTPYDDLVLSTRLMGVEGFSRLFYAPFRIAVNFEDGTRREFNTGILGGVHRVVGSTFDDSYKAVQSFTFTALGRELLVPVDIPERD